MVGTASRGHGGQSRKLRAHIPKHQTERANWNWCKLLNAHLPPATVRPHFLSLLKQGHQWKIKHSNVKDQGRCLSIKPTYFSTFSLRLKASPSLNQKDTSYVILTGLQAEEILLSLPSQPWDYRCVRPYLTLYMGTKDLCSCMTNTLLIEPRPTNYLLL